MKRHGNPGTIWGKISRMQVHHGRNPSAGQLLHPTSDEPPREKSEITTAREANPLGAKGHDAHGELGQRTLTWCVSKDVGLHWAAVSTVTPGGREQTGVVLQAEFMKNIKSPFGTGRDGK